MSAATTGWEWSSREAVSLIVCHAFCMLAMRVLRSTPDLGHGQTISGNCSQIEAQVTNEVHVFVRWNADYQHTPNPTKNADAATFLSSIINVAGGYG